MLTGKQAKLRSINEEGVRDNYFLISINCRNYEILMACKKTLSQFGKGSFNEVFITPRERMRVHLLDKIQYICRMKSSQVLFYDHL